MSSYGSAGSRLIGKWDDQLGFKLFEFTSHDCWVRWGLWGRLRDTGWECGRSRHWVGVGGIPLLLSFTPHSSDTHNLTCLSLTVFSQSHVCHANHIAALIQCGKKVDMLTYPDKCCLILIRHPSIAGSYKELATLRYECHKKLYSYPNFSDRKILDDIKIPSPKQCFCFQESVFVWWKGTTCIHVYERVAFLGFYRRRNWPHCWIFCFPALRAAAQVREPGKCWILSLFAKLCPWW